MTYTYETHGVCSRAIQFDIDGDIIKEINVIGGCAGNLKGVAALCRGRRIDEVVEALRGIRCGSKPTSCPDQIATALLEALEARG